MASAAQIPSTRTMAPIDRALAHLRKAGRRAILIVDTGCGDGALLLRAAKRAAAFGFVAVEALGFDRSPAHIAAARAAARGCADARLGPEFHLRKAGDPLPLDGEADLILAAPGEDSPAALARAAHPSGTILNHR